MKAGDEVKCLRRITVYDPMTFEPEYIEAQTCGNVTEIRTTTMGESICGVRYDGSNITVVHWLKDLNETFVKL